MAYGGGSATSFTSVQPIVTAAIRPDGSVVLGTDDYGQGFRFRVEVLTPTGVPDTSFNGSGVDVVGFGDLQPDWSVSGGNYDRIGWVGVAPDGSIVAGGSTSSGAAFARWHNGTLDATFGTGGRLVLRDRELPAGDHVEAQGGLGPGGAIYEFVETDSLNVGRVQGVARVTSFAAPALAMTYAPAQGSEGTVISFSGSGCPGSSPSVDVSVAIETTPGVFPGVGQTASSTIDGTFSGTLTANEPTGTTATADHTYDIGARCIATGQTIVAGTFTFTPPTPATVVRVSGTDRIATSVAASQASFPNPGSAGAVIIASAENYPDGLAGTPLAASLHAPLLLTHQSDLPANVLNEVARVLPAGGGVIVLGGTAAISDAVTARLVQTGFATYRVSGADRYATATAIADDIHSPTVVLLATGLNFPDALAAGVAAAHVHGVVLFTQGTTQATATQTWLNAHPSLPIIIVGGTAAGTAPSATALIGADRYDTSVKVAQHFFGSVPVAALASGTVFPDALSGGAHIASLGGPILLTPPDTLPTTVTTWFNDNRNNLTTVYIYGGTTAVAQAIADQIATATS